MPDAGYSMLGAGAWGWPREMLWGGRWEGGSCLGTHVRIKGFKINKKKHWCSFEKERKGDWKTDAKNNQQILFLDARTTDNLNFFGLCFPSSSKLNLETFRKIKSLNNMVSKTEQSFLENH